MTPTERLPAGVRLALLTQERLSALAALERACFQGAWSEPQLQEELRAPTGLALGLTREGALCAYALLRVVADEAELLRIGVAPACRRHGLGALLLDACKDELAARGCSALFLEVRESNAAARALYQSAGFSRVGRREGYYRAPDEAALLLRRDL